MGAKATAVGSVLLAGPALLLLTARAASPGPMPPTLVSPAPSATIEVTTSAPTVVPGPLPGTQSSPPNDPAALAKAKKWIDAARLPPGARELGGPSLGAAPQPATKPMCAWLVTATRWWSMPASTVGDVESWLSAHPAAGLRTTGSMTGPGDLRSLLEGAGPNGDDSLQFELAPHGDDVTIRVDVIVVPAGSGCLSAGDRAAAAP